MRDCNEKLHARARMHAGPFPKTWKSGTIIDSAPGCEREDLEVAMVLGGCDIQCADGGYTLCGAHEIGFDVAKCIGWRETEAGACEPQAGDAIVDGVWWETESVGPNAGA
jgi:hypothetical protein